MAPRAASTTGPPRKSVGSESTFSRDLSAKADLVAALEPDSVWEHCARAGLSGRTVTLKAKYADFRQVTRSRTLAEAVPARADLREIGLDLLATLFPLEQGVRLLGLSLSNLAPADAPRARQLSLFA